MRYLAFFISEAFIGMRRSALMMFIAVVTITISLVVFGMFLLMSANMTNLADFISSRLEVRVFLKEGITRQDIKDFKIQIEQMAYVEDVSFVDKDEAWETFKESYSTMSLSDLVSENPLPHALRVVLNNNDHIITVARSIESYPSFVSEVVYGGVIAERMTAFSSWVRFGGLVLVIFLTLATLFIIVNTIRLTVINRKDEIEIMTLVGATQAFICGPFVLEGLFLGTVSAGTAVAVLRAFYLFFANRFQLAMPYFPLILQGSALNQIYFFVLLLGAILGVLGAYISISKILKSSI